MMPAYGSGFTKDIKETNNKKCYLYVPLDGSVKEYAYEYSATSNAYKLLRTGSLNQNIGHVNKKRFDAEYADSPDQAVIKYYLRNKLSFNREMEKLKADINLLEESQRELYDSLKIANLADTYPEDFL